MLGVYYEKIKVSAAIIHNDGAIYATRRAKGTFKGGWEFPGGKIEENESGEEAVVREIKEELDTLIKIEKKLCTVEWQYPEFYLEMECFLAHVESGNLTLKEHDQAKWLKIDDIDSVEWLPADIEVVKEIKAHFANLR